MPKKCPSKHCDETMLPADDMDCERARWVCPECAPDFILMRASTYSDVDVTHDGWNNKY